MTYNVYYIADFRHSILNLDEATLEIVIDAYLVGKDSFTISGQKYYWQHLNYFKIYTNEKGWSKEEIIEVAKKNNLFVDSLGTEYVSEKLLSYIEIGKDVTAEKIGNNDFGKNKIDLDNKELGCYVSQERIVALSNLKSSLDLSKLISLCEELNSNYHNKNFYSVGMIGRAIIDHVPPIFGFKSFNEVANNYGTKSIKGSLQHLNESMRNISDGMLHSHIRKTESLPNANQVNFSQDLDVLLGEIINVFS